MSKQGRHVEGARTKERVLESAASLIATQGYAGTSIAQISKASKTNAASIYWAFESKEGLFAAVMERAAEKYFEQLAQAIPPGQNPDDYVTELAASFENGPEFLHLMLVLSLERRDGNPSIIAAARRVRDRARRSLADAYLPTLQCNNLFDKKRISETLAQLFLMQMDGAFVASQIDTRNYDWHRTFQMITMTVRTLGDKFVDETRSTEK